MNMYELLQGVITALEANTAALKANAGAALVATPPADTTDKVKKATHFHLVDKKQVVKVEAGGERPLGGLEVTAAEAKKLTEKYEADVAKNATPTGATAGANAATSSSSTAAQSGSQSSDGPSFKEVTDAITVLAKKTKEEGGGREKVVELLKLWGVERFPDAQGKKSNADLIADINNIGKPKAADTPAEDDMSSLGL